MSPLARASSAVRLSGSDMAITNAPTLRPESVAAEDGSIQVDLKPFEVQPAKVNRSKPPPTSAAERGRVIHTS